MKLKSPTAETIHVALTNGHAIRIGPEGRDVPEMFRREAFALGAIPFDMQPEQLTGEQEPLTDDSRHAILVGCIKDLLTENNPDDFTGSGLPNRKKVSALVGWNVSAIELGAAWDALKGEAE